MTGKCLRRRAAPRGPWKWERAMFILCKYSSDFTNMGEMLMFKHNMQIPSSRDGSNVFRRRTAGREASGSVNFEPVDIKTNGEGLWVHC